MEKSTFQTRCEIRMAAMGLTQDDVASIVGKPRPRVNEAMRGDKSPAAASLRVAIDQALTRKAGEKREKFSEDLRKAASIQAPHLQGELTLIMPEDVKYIVLEDGIPVGLWNPDTKSYREFPPALGI
ncbi:MAG: hypothetical protein E7645_08320 [Ruminococcaceae bacterium]|nr:hypothetical protein [Oscillospiraceae bacterium]